MALFERRNPMKLSKMSKLLMVLALTMTTERRQFLRTFADKMAKGGLSYPGCGGGPALFPLESVDALRPDYGADIVNLGLELLLEYPDLDELVECTAWLAAGILLHLGGLAVLTKLLPIAQRLLGAKPHLERHDLARLRVLESVVPCLCKRLGQPLPTGFRLMDEQEAFIVFQI
jgi:hypothetical protein